MPEAAKYSTSLEYRQTMRKHGILCAVLVAVLGNSQVRVMYLNFDHCIPRAPVAHTL